MATTSTAMDLLEAHIPLTLLLDLAGMPLVSSQEILAAEGGDADWLARVIAA
jgi:hypothetical protein